MASAALQDVPVFKPTMAEFADFSKYIAKIDRKCESGICKVVAPKEWVEHLKSEADYANIKLQIDTPIKQVVQGMSGIYRILPVEQPSVSVSDFHAVATAYDEEHLPEARRATETAVEQEYWKRIRYRTPTYGADMLGSLMPDTVKSWNLGHLPNVLDVLEDLPGVTTPYLYFGMFGATFAWHTEDLDLYSINYLHFGAPKSWYAIAPGDLERFESVVDGLYPAARLECLSFMRHKQYHVSPRVLHNAGIAVEHTVQHPGEFVITFPRGYHMGFNQGANCAEAINFALERWLEVGRAADRCECQSDMVRIDVDMVEARLAAAGRLSAKARRTFQRRLREEKARRKEEEEEEEEKEQRQQEKGAGKRKRSSGDGMSPAKRAKTAVGRSPVKSPAKSPGRPSAKSLIKSPGKPRGRPIKSPGKSPTKKVAKKMEAAVAVPDRVAADVHLDQALQPRCALCRVTTSSSVTGPILPHPFVGRANRYVWVHANCALHSCEVYRKESAEKDTNGGFAWYNVINAVNRGGFLKCSGCFQRGATIGCWEKCTRSFHLPCTTKPLEFFDAAVNPGKRFYCPKHEGNWEKLGLTRPPGGVAPPLSKPPRTSKRIYPAKATTTSNSGGDGGKRGGGGGSSEDDGEARLAASSSHAAPLPSTDPPPPYMAAVSTVLEEMKEVERKENQEEEGEDEREEEEEEEVEVERKAMRMPPPTTMAEVVHLPPGPPVHSEVRPYPLPDGSVAWVSAAM